MVASRLEKVNMLHAIDKLPSELSGGMKKRAALARAIALDPSIKTIADKILFLKTGEVLLDCYLKEGLESDIADVRDFFSRSAKSS